MDFPLVDRQKTSAVVKEKLTLAQVQSLALLTTKLFHTQDFHLDTLVEPSHRFDLVAKLSRRLIAIHPRCTPALRYLAYCFLQGVPILEQDLEGTSYQGYQSDMLDPNLLAAEFYRKMIAINPRDSDALYQLSLLVAQGVQLQAHDLVGTSLEGHPMEYQPFDYAVALIRKMLNLYSNERDLTYYKAYYQLILYLSENMHYEPSDLKGTQYEGQNLEDLDPDDIMTELSSKIEPANTLESFSSGLTRWQTILEIPLVSVDIDLMRVSIISDRIVDHEELVQALFDSQIKTYLEEDYPKQESALLICDDLMFTALQLYDSKIPITDDLLKDTKWATLPPEQVIRNDLIAEYCRMVLKIDPKNTQAIRLLSLCLLEGVPVESQDLSGTILAKRNPKRVNIQKIAIELYKKMSVYGEKIQADFQFFLSEEPELDSNTQLELESNTQATVSDQRVYCPQFCSSRIHEEQIEPEPDCPTVQLPLKPKKQH